MSSGRCLSRQRDRFDPPDVFTGEPKPLGLEVLFHVLAARRSGQREHADLHGKPEDDLGGTPAQIIFRFAMQIGMLPLTGTTSRQHMEEDLQAERLTLSSEDIERIETIAL